MEGFPLGGNCPLDVRQVLVDLSFPDAKCLGQFPGIPGTGLQEFDDLLTDGRHEITSRVWGRIRSVYRIAAPSCIRAQAYPSSIRVWACRGEKFRNERNPSMRVGETAHNLAPFMAS